MEFTASVTSCQMLSSSDSDDLPGLVHVIASRMYPVFNAIPAHRPQGT